VFTASRNVLPSITCGLRDSPDTFTLEPSPDTDVID
jgi:hypothetical protein